MVQATRGDWMLDAACRGRNASVFYVESERGSTRTQHEETAKAICSGCPVRQRCLEVGLKFQDRFGIWGGLTPRERDRLLTTARWRAG